MKLSGKDIATFGVFAALMYICQMALSFIPNVHLTGVFIITLSVIYRWKAMYPTIVYTLIVGIFNGFAIWWLPYLYIWPLLVAWTTLFMNHMYKMQCTTGNQIKITHLTIGHMAINGIHGLLYGTMYALLYCPITGMNFQEALVWIFTGFPFDLIHGVSNFFMAMLVPKLVYITIKCNGIIDTSDYYPY